MLESIWKEFTQTPVIDLPLNDRIAMVSAYSLLFFYP